MEIIYENGNIVDVSINNVVLQNKLTLEEKLSFFACDHPNPTVWQTIQWLERGELNTDGIPKTTLQLTVQCMVDEGLITQQRATEILS